jgi:hypothetical protein
VAVRVTLSAFAGPAAPGFRRLLLATAISVTGTYAAVVALAIRTFNDTHSAAWVSALFVAEFLPPVVIGVLLAGWLNRLSPRAALAGSDIVSAGVFGVIAFIHRPIAVVALTVLAGAAAGVFRPVVLAAIPGMVEEAELESANAAVAAVDTGMAMLGQAGAGVAVAAAGASVVLGANGVSFGLSALLLASSRSLATPAPQADTGGRWGGIGAGAALIRRTPALLHLTLSWMPMLVVLGVVNSIEAPLLLHSFGAGPATVGFVIAAMSAGIVAGTVVGGRFAESAASRYPLVLAVNGLGVVVAGLSPWLGLVVGAFVVIGFANGIAVVHNRLVLQRNIDSARRAGLIALLMSAGAVMTLLGAAFAGAASAVWNPRAVFAVAGLFGMLVAAPAAALSRPRGSPGT